MSRVERASVGLGCGGALFLFVVGIIFLGALGSSITGAGR